MSDVTARIYVRLLLRGLCDNAPTKGTLRRRCGRNNIIAFGAILHGIMRFVSPFCGMSKKRNRKRAVATQDKENSLNEKRKRRLEGKSRESEKADGRRSGSAGDSASLSFSARLALLTACACLRRGAAEPHLSMTSTRRGAKLIFRVHQKAHCSVGFFMSPKSFTL